MSRKLAARKRKGGTTQLICPAALSEPRIVQAFADIKDNCRSGQLMAIQQAAAPALRHPELPEPIQEKYRRRLGKLRF